MVQAGAARPGRAHHQPGPPRLSSRCPWRCLLLLPWRPAQNPTGFFSRPGSMAGPCWETTQKSPEPCWRTRRGAAAGSGVRTCLVPSKMLWAQGDPGPNLQFSLIPVHRAGRSPQAPSSCWDGDAEVLHRCVRCPEERPLSWNVGRRPYTSPSKAFPRCPTPWYPQTPPCPTRRGSKGGDCHGGAGNAPIFGSWEKRHFSFTITAPLEDGTSIMPCQ